VKELIPQVWDDLDLADGKRTPAGPGPSVILRLNGKSVELDLTEKHKRELEDLLGPYLQAGTVIRGTPQAVPGKSAMAVSRAYNRAMREWGARNGWDIPVVVKSGAKPYHPKALQDAYAAHLEATGGER